MTNTNNKENQTQYYVAPIKNGVSFLVLGVHKIPDNAIAISTEDYNKYQDLNSKGYQFSIVNNEVVTTAPVVPEPTLESRLQELATILDQHQNEGIYFQPSASNEPLLFSSDRGTQSRLSEEVQGITLGLITKPITWTLRDGVTYVKLELDEIKPLAIKALNFYADNNDYAHELQEKLKIDLNTDLTQGWPSNA